MRLINLSQKHLTEKTEETTYLSDTEIKYFMKLYNDYSKETFSLSLNKAPVPSDNPLQIRKNLF